MTRISKRVRDEAILICAIAASTPREHDRHNVSSSSICFDLGLSLDDAWNLSTSARRLAAGGSWSPTARTQETDALAAQMLREGWSPK